jgi:hypothetical protein
LTNRTFNGRISLSFPTSGRVSRENSLFISATCLILISLASPDPYCILAGKVAIVRCFLVYTVVLNGCMKVAIITTRSLSVLTGKMLLNMLRSEERLADDIWEKPITD